MKDSILVAVENTGTGPRPNSAAAIAAAFGASAWLEVSYTDGRARLVTFQSTLPDDELSLNPALFDLDLPVAELYFEVAKVLPKDRQLFRIRNYQYPLSGLFAKEIAATYPPHSCGYVLSTAEEALLDSFFIERLSLPALRTIRDMPVPVMPPGYFNGSVLPDAGRHFPSPELLRFYLEEHFETMLGAPRQLTLDIMPTCNYSCRKCHYHSPLLPHHASPGPGIRRAPPRKPMPTTMVEAVLERARAYPSLKQVHAYMSGEPLLHPDLIQILSLIQKYGFFPSFATNGALLTEDMALRLLDIGIGYIGFSIDALDPELYRHMLGGDLKLVERNIMRWQELCMKRHGDEFYASVMFVAGPENIHQAEAFYNLWTARGFTVLFNVELDIFDRRPAKVMQPRWTANFNYCTAPNCLYLDSEANVLACAAQLNPPAEPSPLNFLSLPPEDLWRSPWLQAARHTLLSGRRLPFCHGCTGLCVMSCSTWLHEHGRTTAVSNAGWYGAPPVDWKEQSDWLKGAVD